MARFGQGLIQALTNPAYADKLNMAGMMAGSMPGRLRDEKEEENKRLREAQIASMQATALGATEEAARKREQAQRVMTGQVASAPPELAAIAQAGAMKAGVKPTDVNAATALGGQRQEAQKRQQGIETLTKIANSSDVNNSNVQKAMKQVAINYGLTKEDLAMFLPSSGDVTRGTGTILLGGKPHLVNFVYDENGNVTRREVLGEKSEKAPVEVKIGGDRGKYFEAVEQADAQQVVNGTTALQTLPAIAQARQLITESPEVFGAGANVFNDMKRGSLVLMDVMGVPKSDSVYNKISTQTSAADLSRTLTQEFVRPRMEATKGAISNREFETFIESVPNLLQTPEGYGRVLDYMENSLNAQIVYSENLDRAYQSQEGPTPSEFKQKWSKFSSEVPLGAFNRDELEQVWQTYNSSGNMANVKFTLTNPVSNEATIVSLEQLKKRANKKGVSVNAFIAEFKNNGQLGLLQ